MILDNQSHAGGVIESHHEGAFTFESGPNTGVLSNIETAELFEELSDLCTIDVANPAAKCRWIWKGDSWQTLPSGLIGGIKTPLFTFADKLRILGEPWRKKGTDPNESLAGLVRRRMGKSFLDYAVNPFIAGIYAGDPETLVTRFAMPKLYKLEQNYGSFIKGAIKKSKEPKASNAHLITKEVFSFKGGLDNLVKALVKKIGQQNIRLNCHEIAIEANSQSDSTTSGYRVTGIQKGDPFVLESSTVITTCGAHALPQMLPFINSNDLQPFNNLKYAPITQVVAGFEKWQGIPINAFGGLVPGIEKRQILGVLFPSSFLSNRAPEGGALLSIFMGGIRLPHINTLDNEEIMKIAAKETQQMMGLKEFKPDMLRIFRYNHAIPQYEANSDERIETIKRIMTQYPGLIIGGNAHQGIGMADRIKQGREIADNYLG